jgi:hypothetical protein
VILQNPQTETETGNGNVIASDEIALRMILYDVLDLEVTLILHYLTDLIVEKRGMFISQEVDERKRIIRRMTRRPLPARIAKDDYIRLIRSTCSMSPACMGLMAVFSILIILTLL